MKELAPQKLVHKKLARCNENFVPQKFPATYVCSITITN